MNFEKFKKYIDAIKITEENEDALSKCFEEKVARSTHCIVDICSETVNALIEILADYYSCQWDEKRPYDNDISWWLFEDVEKIIYVKEEGKQKEVPVPDVKSFWKYLEKHRKKKLKKVRTNGYRFLWFKEIWQIYQTLISMDTCFMETGRLGLCLYLSSFRNEITRIKKVFARRQFARKQR